MANRKQTTSFTIGMPGLPSLLRVLSKLPKELQNEIRDSATEIAETEAKKIIQNAVWPQERLAASAVRARRDRIPVIVAGGAKRLSVSGGRSGARRPRAGDVFFGAEFGGQGRKTTMQFQPHNGTEGHFFFPTLREDHDKIMDTWLDAVDGISKDWTSGSDSL